MSDDGVSEPGLTHRFRFSIATERRWRASRNHLSTIWVENVTRDARPNDKSVWRNPESLPIAKGLPKELSQVESQFETKERPRMTSYARLQKVGKQLIWFWKRLWWKVQGTTRKKRVVMLCTLDSREVDKRGVWLSLVGNFVPIQGGALRFSILVRMQQKLNWKAPSFYDHTEASCFTFLIYSCGVCCEQPAECLYSFNFP